MFLLNRGQKCYSLFRNKNPPKLVKQIKGGEAASLSKEKGCYYQDNTSLYYKFNKKKGRKRVYEKKVIKFSIVPFISRSYFYGM